MSIPERISVALCTHNGARYIRQQLESIMRQSLPLHELVVSDDASSDDTVAIVRATVAEWATVTSPPPQLVVLENERPLGVTANFEQAILRTTGSLVVLSDQDDIWRSDRLSLAADQFARRPGLSVLFTDARLIDDADAVLPGTLLSTLEVSAAARASVHAGDAMSVFIRRNVATGATMMFRRSLLDIAVPFPSTWVHDEWIATLAACLGEIDLLEETLVDYRQHGANQIGVTAPTLKRKIGRVFAPRADRNRLIAAKFQDLDDRLETLGCIVPDHVGAVVTGKARAERARAALPSRRIARLPWIIGAARRGWYDTYFSQGKLDIVRDLLQAH